MHVLVIEDNPEITPIILPILEEKLEAVIQETYSIQEGIEILENPQECIDLVVCDYHGQSNSLLKCLLQLCSELPCVLCSDETYSITDVFKVPALVSSDTVNRSHLAENLKIKIDLLVKKGLFKDKKTPDSDFIRASTKRLFLSQKIKSDIYIRYAQDRFSKLYRDKDSFDSNALEKYLSEKKIEHFYVKKDQAAEVVSHQTEDLDQLNQEEPVPRDQGKEVVTSSLEIIQDLVKKVGFTPEVQDLAKKSVQLTLKVVGAKPRLANVLTKLKAEEGKYITSHSFMLAEISCALACKVGWQSAPTFLKLTLASFIHDLPITQNHIARYRTVEEAQGDPKMSPDDLLAFKLHPIHAAEYARQLQEIPPDVDTILSQHHEEPDGTGFPRRAFHHQLSPLSCLFIVSHDLLHFTLNEAEASIEKFVKARQEKYKMGIFKKILLALEKPK